MDKNQVKLYLWSCEFYSFDTKRENEILWRSCDVKWLFVKTESVSYDAFLLLIEKAYKMLFQFSCSNSNTVKLTSKYLVVT